MRRTLQEYFLRAFSQWDDGVAPFIPKAKHRLSFRLAKYTVVLAFIIGVLLSFFQIFNDYKQQVDNIDRSVIRIINISRPPSIRAVETLDKILAHEITHGLMQYPFVIKTYILDERGEAIAEQHKDVPKSEFTWLTSTLGIEKKKYVIGLTPQHARQGLHKAPVKPLGKLVVVVNLEGALKPLFERILTIFMIAIINSFLLSGCLVIMFHIMITRPLEKLAIQFMQMHPEHHHNERLTISKKYYETELGQLCTAGNNFIGTIQKLLEKNNVSRKELKKSELRLEQLLNHMPQLIMIVSAKGIILFCNQELANFYKKRNETIVGKTLEDIHYSVTEVQDLIDIIDKVMAENSSGKDITEVRWSAPDKKRHYFSLTVAVFEHFAEPAALVVATDISEQRMVQDHIVHIANHDSLTGLPNRTMLNDRLAHAVSTCKRNNTYNALLFIDLDHFKKINDSLGHGVGDLLLMKVSEILTSQVRANDTVARLGGDEFVILIQSTHRSLKAITLDVEKICEKLLFLLSQTIEIKQHRLRIGASIGGVFFPTEEKNVDDLMRFADTAMYHAKENGRNGYAFYHHSMSSTVEKQQQMEHQLMQALEREEFQVYFQPLVGHNGKVKGFESLLRWQHPSKGLILPSDFIPALEASGLIVPVSYWVLKQCGEQIVEWKKQNIWNSNWAVSVNISPLQFYQTDMVTALKQAIESSGADYTDICLEITETIAVENIEFAVKRLNKIHDLGMKIALDDFGTGYSSLSYLRDLPVDSVKIDRSFIQDITEGNRSKSIVEAVNAIARAYDLLVVAEGIETKEQLDTSYNMGCHIFQGFLISRPQPAGKLEFDYSYIIKS